MRLCLIALLFSSSSLLAAEPLLPQKHDPERHRSTWENSPFERQVLPVKPPPPPEQAPVGWQLTAIDKVNGRYTIALRDKKRRLVTLTEGVRGVDGLSIDSIQSTGSIASAVVIITDGERRARVEFQRSSLNGHHRATSRPPSKAR